MSGKPDKKEKFFRVKPDEVCPECFRAAGEPNRYKIVRILGDNPEGVTVCDLADRLKLSQPTVTHHLKILQDAGMVSYEKRGRECHFVVRAHGRCFTMCKIPYKNEQGASSGE